MFSIVMPTSPVQPTQSWKGCPSCGAKVAATKSCCPICQSNRDYKKAFASLQKSNDPCSECPSNPAYNPEASGICHCTLGNRAFR